VRRVEIFQLSHNSGAAAFGQPVDLYKRGIANQVSNTIRYFHFSNPLNKNWST
jgi:hypothetical protein